MSTSISAELHTLENLVRTAHEAAEPALLLRHDPKQYGRIHLATQELRKARVTIQSLKRANKPPLDSAQPGV